MHAHPWMGVTLVVSGQFQDMTEGRTAVCRPLTLVVKPDGAEHETRVGPDGALSIYFELAPTGVRRLAELGLEIGRCGYFGAGPATAALLGLLRPEDPGSPSRISDVLADAILTRRVDASAIDTVATSEFAKGILRATTREAATAAAMHPVSFSRLFRRATGVAPSRWRLQQRIAHAAAALAGGLDSIALIADAAGFADQAHLCRMFRRETGLTPGQYRGLIQAFRVQAR